VGVGGQSFQGGNFPPPFATVNPIYD
jgi:hypothetical protein